MTTLSESTVEAAALEWLHTLGWQMAHGPDIAPDTPGAERDNYGQVVLEQRLQDALARLNLSLPASAQDDALRRLTHPEGATLEARNRSFHRMLVAGVTVEYRTGDGAIRGEQARVIDFDDWAANDWLAVNQFTVTENRNTPPPRRRPLRQWPAPGRHRAEEPHRRGRHRLDRLAATSDLPGRTPYPVRHERCPHRLRRPGRPHRDSHRRAGVVQALAHHHRRDFGRPRI